MELEHLFRAQADAVADQLIAFTEEQYGLRCEDYDRDCACCRAWRIVDQFNKLND